MGCLRARGTVPHKGPLGAVAEILTKSLCLEPEVCICKGRERDFKGESAAIMKVVLPNVPQICLSNDISSSGSTILYL